MRHARVTLAAILAVLFCAAWASAATKSPPAPNQPVQPQVVPPRPVKSQPPAAANQRHPLHDAPPEAIVPYGIYYRYYPYFDGYPIYDPYYSNGYYDPYGYSPYYYRGLLPPAFVPVDDYFGPVAAQRFMGMNQQQANASSRPWRENHDADERPRKTTDRATNSQATALASKFIGYGDALFAQQKYSEANSRYRKATESAPQMADAWFRQGFALAATGRYEMAISAFKRGVSLDPNWSQSGFDLGALYGPNAMAKTAQLDALANFALGKPDDPDLLFLIGLHLHFDGQTDRAKVFFQRAARLAGENADYIQPFLKDEKKP
jgi:tetratricopeptide (TPR) repeat protein